MEVLTGYQDGIILVWLGWAGATSLKGRVWPSYQGGFTYSRGGSFMASVPTTLTEEGLSETPGAASLKGYLKLRPFLGVRG
jgi:hypothetical protein